MDLEEQKITQLAAIEYLQNNASLLESKSHSDVTFVVGGEGEEKQEFAGHKVIFAVRCPVFAKMFEHDFEENKLNRVVITDMNPKVFEQFMKFVYTAKVDSVDQFDEELLVAADKVCCDFRHFV